MNCFLVSHYSNTIQSSCHCYFARTCQCYRHLVFLRRKTEYPMRRGSKKLLIISSKGGGGCVAKFSVQVQIANDTSYVNIFKLWYQGRLKNNWNKDLLSGIYYLITLYYCHKFWLEEIWEFRSKSWELVKQSERISPREIFLFSKPWK